MSKVSYLITGVPDNPSTWCRVELRYLSPFDMNLGPNLIRMRFH